MDVAAAAAFLGGALPAAPRVSVVLGSGLGRLVEALDERTSVAFEDVPGFPPSGVPGHEGRFVAGRLRGLEVLFHCGRYHYYEGHRGDVIAAPVRVAAELGVEAIIFTNAAGAVSPELGPGDVVLVDDHMNLMFRSPLAGAVQGREERFPDMSAPYDEGLGRLAFASAARVGVHLARGVYAAVLGPAYETPAEVRMLALVGADVVGMSTVPEVIVARALGLRCLAFSVVTNKATGLGGPALSHEEVLQAGVEAGTRLTALVSDLFTDLGAGLQSVSTK